MRRHGEEADPGVIGDEAVLEGAAPDPESGEASASPEPAAGTPGAPRAEPESAPSTGLDGDRVDSERADGR